MRMLAIETSCDETAIAIVEFTGPPKRPVIRILSNIVSSQVKLHAKFGGVVPNLAKREHQKNLPLILRTALKEGRFSISKQILKSKIQKLEKILEREPELLKKFIKHILRLPVPEIDAIAVTVGPGLAPALWVGVNFAKALAYFWKKPLIPINHMEGHLFSALLQKSGKKNFQFSIFNFQFPALALLVSGGHTELVLVKGYGKYKIIGETLDDAAGEAFDKVARILGLGYPGGPEVSRLAEKGDPHKYKLPSPMINSKDYDFSFSGLKTAVLYLVRNFKQSYETRSHKLKGVPDIAASFQKAVVDVLVKKTIRAAKEYKVRTVLLGGGVAANKLLRKDLVENIKKYLPNTNYQLPVTDLTGDNALMIALAAYFTGMKKAQSQVGACANLRIGHKP